MVVSLFQRFTPCTLIFLLIQLVQIIGVSSFATTLSLGVRTSTPSTTMAFVTLSHHPQQRHTFLHLLRMSTGDDEANVADDSASVDQKTKLSLEEKMKSWEASEEEIKAASLGGLTPGKGGGGVDGFDVGLGIAFPIMVGSSLLFLLFPFMQGMIDFDSVGPPPMQ